MGLVGVRRAEQTQDFVIFRFLLVLRIFDEVFVDLVPEGCPNPPDGCPKPLGLWFWTYGALPIKPIGPYFGSYFPFVGCPIFPLWPAGHMPVGPSGSLHKALKGPKRLYAYEP